MDIEPVTLFRIVRLRADVFIFEQEILSEQDLDDRDIEESTTHFWVEEDDGSVSAALRVLSDPKPVHIGRVVTAKAMRGRGIAGRLVEAAIAQHPGPIEISAQAYLENWYERFGFARTGPSYLEAGIDHVPMVRR